MVAEIKQALYSYIAQALPLGSHNAKISRAASNADVSPFSASIGAAEGVCV